MSEMGKSVAQSSSGVGVIGSSNDRLMRLSQALSKHPAAAASDTSPTDMVTTTNINKAVELQRSDALVEVLITYGCACTSGDHGEHVFNELRVGLENKFRNSVFVLAREEPNSYSCISIHVNNVLVFGCQGRRPTIEQLCDQVNRAMDGKKPRLIPYNQAVASDFYGLCQKHKYRV